MSEYLNRQDVLNAINDVMNDSEILHKFRALRKRINQIAVADVAEVVHGKWLEDDYGYFRCSECGSEQDTPEYTTPFCPLCGAKMDAEQEKDT